MKKFTRSPFLFSIFVIAFFSGSHSICDNSSKKTANEKEKLFYKYDLDKIVLPPGFKISVFAEVPDARSMCYGEKGTLFVGNRQRNKVYAVRDEDKDGVADKVYTLASGLTMPCGV